MGESAEVNMRRTAAADVPGDTGAQLPLLFLIQGCWLFIAGDVAIIFVIVMID